MLRRLSSPRQFSTNPKTIPKTNTKAKAKAKDMVKAKAKPFRPNIENLYSKKTPIEHVLLRPGMYVGSVSPMPASTSHYFDPLSHRMKPWESLPLPLPLPSSLDEHSHSQMQKMQNQRPLIRPALLKIFDEILVNAADNYRRDPLPQDEALGVTASTTSTAIVAGRTFTFTNAENAKSAAAHSPCPPEDLR